MKSIRIAGRASKLALIQTDIVRRLLENLSSDIDCSVVKIITKGDRDKSDFLYQAESRGFFTSEVENALLDGRADLAVHSLKDLPTLPRDGLVIAAVPKRESPADVLIAKDKVTSIEQLQSGSKIGTSSLRRIAQIKLLRDDIECVPLRGNVETRVRKVTEGNLDAIVIACAGLNRLGLADKISAVLPPKEFIPAPAQGALAVQIRSDDKELAELVRYIDDENSRIVVEAERCVLETIHGGCSVPLGVYSHIDGGTITTDAILCDLDGNNYVKRSVTSSIAEAKTSAQKLARELLDNGGRQILDHIRN